MTLPTAWEPFAAELVPLCAPDHEKCASPGKVPHAPAWQTTAFDARKFNSGNVGLRSRYFPAVDIDVDDPAIVDAIEDVARETLGSTARRSRSNSPRRALLYRLDGEPFKKSLLKFTTPNGASARIEVLADGQQLAVHGVHSTGAALEWAEQPAPEALAPMSRTARDEFLSAVRGALEAAGCLFEAERQTLPVSPAPVTRSTSPDRRLQRASAYLASIPGAVSGAGGHDQTMAAALKVVRGFQLSEAEAFDLLASDYNPRCVPPWSDKELRHKVKSAVEDGRLPWGYLLNAEREGPLPRDAATSGNDWPTLLRFDSVDVPPFPLDALPGWLRDFVEDVASFTQVYPDMPGMLSLASLSTACAGRYHVEVRDGYTEPLNLFVCVALDSGDRKTPTFKLCTQPLRDVEAELMERARVAIVAAEQKRKGLEGRLAHLQKQIAKDDGANRASLEIDAVKVARELEELPRILTPRLLADDITPQALGILLQNCGEQIGVYAPEGGIFKTLGGRYSDGQADLDLVLKSYAGEPVTVDRVSRATVRLKRPLVTFALTVQPRILRDLGEMPGAQELGFPGRFLYSVPRSEVGKRTAAAPAMRGDGAQEYERKIRKLLDGRTPGGDTVPIRMGAAALAVRDAFHDEIEPRLLPGVGDLAVPGVKEWARKLVGTMARLAGILHAAQEADPPAVEVSEQTAQAAVAICRYLTEHARAAFLTMGTDPEVERARMALEWIKRKRCSAFTLRELFESKRRSFDDKATVLRAALELLEQHAYIRALPAAGDGPGRKSEQYEVRPGFVDSADYLGDGGTREF